MPRRNRPAGHRCVASGTSLLVRTAYNINSQDRLGDEYDRFSFAFSAVDLASDSHDSKITMRPAASGIEYPPYLFARRHQRFASLRPLPAGGRRFVCHGP
jgi:hypothetical protein